LYSSLFQQEQNTTLALLVSLVIIFLVMCNIFEVAADKVAACKEHIRCDMALSAVQHDPLSILELVSAAASFTANSMAIVIYALDEDISENFRNVFAGFMCIAVLLAWLRCFDLVRGHPSLGFYSQLVIQSFIDARFFLFLLIISIGAFASATASLIQIKHEVVDDTTWFDRLLHAFFWHSTVEDGCVVEKRRGGGGVECTSLSLSLSQIYDHLLVDDTAHYHSLSLSLTHTHVTHAHTHTVTHTPQRQS